MVVFRVYILGVAYLNGKLDENIDNVQNTSCTALHN